MKLSLPIRLSKKGITIARYGDKITYPWKFLASSKLFSENYRLLFDNLNQYKSYKEQEELHSFNKLDGFNYTDILSQWVKYRYPFDHVVILTNVNVEAKNIAFWAKVPISEISHFLKDITVLRCKDLSELERLLRNIPTNFADAYGYSKSVLLLTNKEF